MSCRSKRVQSGPYRADDSLRGAAQGQPPADQERRRRLRRGRAGHTLRRGRRPSCLLRRKVAADSKEPSPPVAPRSGGHGSSAPAIAPAPTHLGKGRRRPHTLLSSFTSGSPHVAVLFFQFSLPMPMTVCESEMQGRALRRWKPRPNPMPEPEVSGRGGWSRVRHQHSRASIAYRCRCGQGHPSPRDPGHSAFARIPGRRPPTLSPESTHSPTSKQEAMLGPANRASQHVRRTCARPAVLTAGTDPR